MISEFDLLPPLMDLAAKYYPTAAPIRQRLIWRCPNGSNLFLYVKSFYCFQLQSCLDCTSEREWLFVELEMDDSIEWNWDGKKSIIRTNGILVSLMTFHFLSISAYEMANSGTGKECKKPPHKPDTGIKIFPKFGTGKGMKNPIPQFERRNKNISKIRDRQRNENSIPDLIQEQESVAFIPGNGREREFPLTTAWLSSFENSS